MSKLFPIHFGIEQEHFVFHPSKRIPSHETIEAVWDLLITHCGFRTRCTNASGMRLSIEYQSRYGPVVISNDSCTHILEVAFPKMVSVDAFADLYESTWRNLEHYLNELDLAIYFGSCIDDCSPRNSVIGKETLQTHSIDLHDLGFINWRPKETDQEGVRLNRFLTRSELINPLFVRSFPACFAATHVSLNIATEEIIRRLPGLYAREAEVPRRFSQCRTFRGVNGRCVRLLAWLANFHLPYPMLGIPDRLPSSWNEYQELCSQCDGRDFSFVSIRDDRRVEFRSACSQPTVNDIVELIQFRFESFQAALDHPKLTWEAMREDFLEACRKG